MRAQVALPRRLPHTGMGHKSAGRSCEGVMVLKYTMSQFWCLAADTLVDVLTVEEMLLYTAELKRPLRESSASKKHAVNSLVQDLNLSGCRATRIGNSLQPGILGGQVSRSPLHPVHAGACELFQGGW